jgi:uncharacterized protein YkwD
MTFRFLVIAMTIGVLAGAAQAQPSAPNLRAKALKDDSIRLTWSGVRAAAGTLTVLEIERGAAKSATEPLATVPARPRKYLDVPESPGVYWYRARVVTDGQPSAWGTAVSAEVLPEPTPKPVPTSTPSGGNPGDPPLGAGQHECRAGAIDETLGLINDARRSANTAALRDDADLRWAARKRAIAIATSQQLDHNGWVEAIRASGYRFSVAAENIASGYWSPSAVVQGWLGSSGHYDNIVSRTYRDTGIGCVIDKNGKLWWTEEFGG